MRQLLIALSLVFVASTAFAETLPAPTPSTTQCSKQRGKTRHTRTLELKSTETGGCKVYLTRDGGEPDEVAHAAHQLHVCSDVQQKVLANLKEAGFTCEEGTVALRMKTTSSSR